MCIRDRTMTSFILSLQCVLLLLRCAASPNHSGSAPCVLKFSLLPLYCLAFTDSGATHSFISSEYCRRHGLQYKRLRSSVALADGSSARVVGVLRRLPLKIASFRCKQTFLVLDMRGYDVVLGYGFSACAGSCVELSQAYYAPFVFQRFARHCSCVRRGARAPSCRYTVEND